MFLELPLVLMPRAMSFFCPSPSICFWKIVSYPKSLAKAVNIDVFVDRAIAGSAFLFK